MSNIFRYKYPILEVIDVQKKIKVIIEVGNSYIGSLSIEEFTSEDKHGEYVDLSCMDIVRYIEEFTGGKIKQTNCIAPIAEVSEKIFNAFKFKMPFAS